MITGLGDGATVAMGRNVGEIISFTVGAFVGGIAAGAYTVLIALYWTADRAILHANILAASMPMPTPNSVSGCRDITPQLITKSLVFSNLGILANVGVVCISSPSAPIIRLEDAMYSLMLAKGI
jgi:hypothetical protein